MATDQYLSCNVCDRSRCNLCHPMDARIAGSRGFRLFFDGAWGSKYMPITLQKCVIVPFHKIDQNSLIQVKYSGKGHSRGLLGRSYNHDKGR
jgi:hypothetical protein